MVRLYRGPLLLVIFLFLMGINVYCWRSSGVNHVLIFELDPRNHLTEQHIMELATVFGLVWAGSALIFLYSEKLHIPPYINPLILAVLMIAFLFNPTKTLRHDARFWVLRVAVSYTLQFYICRVILFFVHAFFMNRTPSQKNKCRPIDYLHQFNSCYKNLWSCMKRTFLEIIIFLNIIIIIA